MPDRSKHRLTVDTSRDLEALAEITGRAGDRVIPWREILEIMRTNPHIAKINEDVRQKDVVEG